MSVNNKYKKINCIGENCPVPLVEVRKAIIKGKEGELIEVTGDHPASKKEIPMALEEMGLKLLEITETDNIWTIRFKNTKDDSNEEAG